MKAAFVHEFTDDPASIRVEDVPVPQPSSGQVRVRMRLAPINPSDLNFLRGTYHSALRRVVWNAGRDDVAFDPERRNLCPVPPYALGGEGLGVVEAAGSGILARRLLGRRVAVAGVPPNGTWQECVVVDARRAVPLPARISDEQGAMFFVNPLTACVLVRKVLRVRRGDWVLLTAAGSALGKAVVRMARRDGFRTVCVVRGATHAAELRSLGAEAVIETDRQDLVTEVARVTFGRGVPHALDCVGGELAGQVVRCLGVGGHLVLYGTLADAPLVVPSRDLMMPMARVSGFLLPVWLAGRSPLELLGLLRSVKNLMGEGVFHADVAQTFPLDRVADAVRASLQPGRTGKVMLKIPG